MTDIASNVQSVLHIIRVAAAQAGRNPHTIRLVAATKYVEVSLIRQAITAGVTICGENRLQESQAKREILGEQPGLSWHFIGRLQRRKLKLIVGQFALLHSVESLEQIEELDRRAEEQQVQQAILLQVNLGNESTKGGFLASDLLQGMPKISKFCHIMVQGLMTIPPREEEPEATRPYFRKLKDLADEIKALRLSGVQMEELSMGMSNDYSIAIQEGATIVRVGSALFGKRPQP